MYTPEWPLVINQEMSNDGDDDAVQKQEHNPENMEAMIYNLALIDDERPT